LYDRLPLFGGFWNLERSFFSCRRRRHRRCRRRRHNRRHRRYRCCDAVVLCCVGGVVLVALDPVVGRERESDGEAEDQDQYDQREDAAVLATKTNA
jgi:hypothetical protein